jgi:glycine/D-amino acid oxidase-like deaminating enzyme
MCLHYPDIYILYIIYLQNLNQTMAEKTELVIVGQGLCGTFLSLELERAGISHIVIDERRPFSASRAAAGLINPVTGRRIVTTWMIDELLPFAAEAYARLRGLFGSSFFEPAIVTDFFPTAQMRLAFLRRLEEGGAYLRLPKDEHAWDDCFHVELGYGLIDPCWLVDVPGLLDAARQRMIAGGVLREERFDVGELVVDAALVGGSALSGLVGPGRVRWRDIEAGGIVFCDGVESFSNPYFSRLPFAPNKGEVLIVEIDGLADSARAGGGTVFKKGLSIVPWREGLYWVGSSYEWRFEHAEPTEGFRLRTEAALREWLKLSFRTVEHLAAVRPATLERRPFVGFHPQYPRVGILNGMGTKGCSLAPYFAQRLVRYLVDGNAILAEADVKRFEKVLSRR